jgi:hypothetical protein
MPDRFYTTDLLRKPHEGMDRGMLVVGSLTAFQFQMIGLLLVVIAGGAAFVVVRNSRKEK